MGLDWYISRVGTVVMMGRGQGGQKNRNCMEDLEETQEETVIAQNKTTRNSRA